MNAWSHLPNAHHIDRTIESVKENPEIWSASWNASWNATMAAYDAARDAAWAAAARSAARDATRDAAMDAASDATRGAAWCAAWYAAWAATAALIVYDDASKYLEMSSDQLRVWAILSEDPAAVLLLPAVIAFERIRELELT
jgi:hypothetical protein